MLGNTQSFITQKVRPYKTAVLSFTKNQFFSMSDHKEISQPKHYGGADNPHEAIKVIQYYDLSFCLGNVIKYIFRCGKKDPVLKELIKAREYDGMEAFIIGVKNLSQQYGISTTVIE